ncbi:MAG TPA: serine hydrolase, partial [Verrucomicrobiae bacterium]|nr:serine hydrolase [Verrucomicrobiae bacterium]
RERTIAGLLSESYTDGFLLLQRGRVLAEWYDSTLAPALPHIIFSVSKSVTGTLAGVLVERGLLDPEAPVTRYIPEAAGSAYGDCTVRHVLDMTVSTEFVEDYLDPNGDFARYRIATGWNPVDPAKATDLRSFLVTLRRGKHPHGRDYHYVSPNSDLMGWILERAGGQPYAELLSEALWQPLGAEFDAYTAVDRLGAPRPAGGLCVSLRDLARFAEMMRCRGMAEGRQVIPGWWVDDIRNNGDAGPWQRSEAAKLAPKGRYRSKWYVLGNDHGAFCGIGIHGQWVYVDPAAEITIAKLSSQPLPVDDPTDFLILAGFEAIGKALA